MSGINEVQGKQFRNTNYLVTEDGRVYSTILKAYRKLHKMPNGYMRATIIVDGKICSFLVHRMVSECYIHNFNNLEFVNHINSNRQDNRVENLEWCTRLENAAHMIKMNRQSRKLNPNQVVIIKTKLKSNTKVSKLAQEFNVTFGCIDAIKAGRTWKHVQI